MILGFPRAKQGLCHTKPWGAGGIILWALLTVFLVSIKMIFLDYKIWLYYHKFLSLKHFFGLRMPIQFFTGMSRWFNGSFVFT